MQAITAFDTRDKTREEWLAARRRGIGGSDAAAIMGVNSYESPLAVYMDKLGLAPEKDETEAMRQGRDLEQYVADRFVESTGKKVRRCNRILKHPEYEWMLGNIDRDIVGENAGLECKTTSVLNKTAFDQGDIPATYYWQCTHYMAVTGASKWYLAVLVLNKALHIFEIERDENAIMTLVAAEESFWRDYVLAQVPPMPSGLECDDALVDLIPGDKLPGDVVDLSEHDARITSLKAVEADMSALKKQADAMKQTLAMTLGAATEGRTTHYRVTYRPQVRRNIDADRLRDELPNIAAEYAKEIKSRPMRITEVKSNG
ncbi:MAG: YqaJ viral recombinase family protein [Kiritimatiellales bacterium]